MVEKSPAVALVSMVWQTRREALLMPFLIVKHHRRCGISQLSQVLEAKRSKARMELFIPLCWVTWHSMNLFIFEGKKEDSQESLAKVEKQLWIYIGKLSKIPNSNNWKPML